MGTADGTIYGTHVHTPERPGEVWRLSPNGEPSIVFKAPHVFEMSRHALLIATDETVYSTNVYDGRTAHIACCVAHHLDR